MTYLTDIERLNYYEGEFLGAVDFQAEQEYHRDMRRRHNLGQHTWGIVTGLELAQPPNGNTNSNGTEVDVYLQPGMAVDGFGREIVVLNQAQLTTSMLSGYYSSQPASPVTMYVWIGYQQNLLEPPSDACTSMNSTDAYARIQETYTLSVTQTDSPPSATPLVVVNGVATAAPPEPSSSSSSSAAAASSSPGAGTTVTSSTTSTISSGSSSTTISSTTTTTSSPSSSSASPSASGTSAALTDPPAVTLPYDDSVPYQEFSTDDSSIIWWLPIGTVLWDLNNQVFLQPPGSSSQGQSSSNMCREYVGNVSEITYTPGGKYKIVDRNSPYPPVASANDPNLGGVQAEVAGSLQVDFLLNAELTVLIGAQYNTNNQVTRPLTIVASGGDQDLIELRNSSQQPAWYLNEEFDGKTLGLNLGEVGPNGNVDNRIFVQPTLTTPAPSQQNVGIGSSTPRNPIGIRGQGAWWELLSFEDNKGTTQWHINHNPQGTPPGGGSYTPGLNFSETGQADFRLFLQSGGNVGIGTGMPVANLDVASGLFHVGGSTSPSITTQGAYLGWNALTGGTGETDFINQQGKATGEFAGGFAFMNVTTPGGSLNTLMYIAGDGDVGIGTRTPEQNLSVNEGVNIDQANDNNGSAGDGISPGLTFGSGSGEGIASCRGGGVNAYGLDFYTDFAVQVSISQQGEVGVDQSNQNAGNSLVPGLVFGTNAAGRSTTGFGTGEGIASNRTTVGLNVSPGANQYGLDFYTQSHVRMQITNDGDVHIMGHLWANGVQLA